MSRSKARGRLIAQPRPEASASSRWRSQLPGPKLGLIASQGLSRRPFVPVPCRSGMITTAGGPAARSNPSRSSGSSDGQSPGMQSARSLPSASARSTPTATAALWPLSERSAITIAPCSAAAAATDSSPVTTIVSSIWLASARAASTSATIAAASSRRRSSATLAPSRCLATEKRFTGRIAAVRMRCAEPSRPAAQNPSSISPAVIPGPTVTNSPYSPGRGSHCASVSLSTYMIAGVPTLPW